METVTLAVESYLFKDGTHQFRAIPFYELSIDERVVYQDGMPKYMIDFNRREKPIIQFLTKQLKGNNDLDGVVNKLGKQFNQRWTTRHNIDGEEIADSWQVEQVKLELFDGLENWDAIINHSQSVMTQVRRLYYFVSRAFSV